MGWIDERYDLDRDAWSDRTELFDHFSIVADFDAKKPMSRSEFYNRLDGIDGIWKAKRQGHDGFRGIRLKSAK